jgi:hypothetical protein
MIPGKMNTYRYEIKCNLMAKDATTPIDSWKEAGCQNGSVMT